MFPEVCDWCAEITELLEKEITVILNGGGILYFVISF